MLGVSALNPGAASVVAGSTLLLVGAGEAVSVTASGGLPNLAASAILYAGAPEVRVAGNSLALSGAYATALSGAAL